MWSENDLWKLRYLGEVAWYTPVCVWLNVGPDFTWAADIEDIFDIFYFQRHTGDEYTEKLQTNSEPSRTSEWSLGQERKGNREKWTSQEKEHWKNVQRKSGVLEDDMLCRPSKNHQSFLALKYIEHQNYDLYLAVWNLEIW